LKWENDAIQAKEGFSAGVGKAAVIVVDDAAEDVAALDKANVLGLAVGNRATLVNALMRLRNVEYRLVNSLSTCCK